MGVMGGDFMEAAASMNHMTVSEREELERVMMKMQQKARKSQKGEDFAFVHISVQESRNVWRDAAGNPIVKDVWARAVKTFGSGATIELRSQGRKGKEEEETNAFNVFAKETDPERQ